MASTPHAEVVAGVGQPMFLRAGGDGAGLWDGDLIEETKAGLCCIDCFYEIIGRV